MTNSQTRQGAAPKTAKQATDLSKAERELIAYCRKHGLSQGRSLRQQLIDEWFTKSPYAAMQRAYQNDLAPYLGDFWLEWQEEFSKLQTMLATSPATAILVESRQEVDHFVVSQRRFYRACRFVAQVQMHYFK